MFSECRNLILRDRWEGYFDGVGTNKTLRGWAFNKLEPTEEIELHLLIRGIHVATTFANLPRHDVDKKFDLDPPANSGFEFDMQSFEPKGALELLRSFGQAVPQIAIASDVRVEISASRFTLRGARAQILDMNDYLPALQRAAAIQLRHDHHAGALNKSLSVMDQEILLNSNPLFHAGFYEETFPEIPESGLTPVRHFLSFSTELERPASPWFDTAAYLDAVPEARKSNLPALLHYDLHGHDTWWPGQGKFRENGPNPKGNSDYAVLIHLYHMDTVDDLKWTLRSFAPDVDIFITIPENSDAHDPAVIEKLFPQVREIFAVPNRGQDIGAFLYAVRQLSGRGYRFFCKMHSKKGNKYPDIWRRIMFDSLSVTPHRVEQVVSLFRENSRVLIAGPEEFWFNGSSFLSANESGLKSILDRLMFGQSAANDAWGFFAGSCFWVDAPLAELIAGVLADDDFENTLVSRDGQMAHAAERIFTLVAHSIGGKVALLSGRNWDAVPRICDSNGADQIRVGEKRDIGRFLADYLRKLTEPHSASDNTSEHGSKNSDTDHLNVDRALHGAIDVIINCWAGDVESLHSGLASLSNELGKRGLTSAFVVVSNQVVEHLETNSCTSITLERAMMFPPQTVEMSELRQHRFSLESSVANLLLRSECLFLNKNYPEGEKLIEAVERIEGVYGLWRKTLIDRKVKLFLIWGTTAPKSLMFLHLCKELGIEYQIIERGHFPGTLSVDPMGQFGTSVIPRLVQHVSRKESADLDARFDAIRKWYYKQSDNAAYTKFQRRDTREIAVMKRSRSFGRPVILVIGSNDQGAGVVGPNPDPLRVNWFGTSDDAFNIIRQLISKKFPEALLVLRPHPSQTTQETDFVLVARDSALDDLVDHADLCISVATTSSALCLIKDKPLLTLGLSELNGSDVGVSIKDETHLLSAIRHAIWSDFKNPYPRAQNRQFIVDLFDRHLVGVNSSIPTCHHIPDLADLVAGRIQRMKTGFLQDYDGREGDISRAMFEDVRDRGRAIFPVDPRAFNGRIRPGISVVLPIYGDYEGTRICFEQLMRHQAENGYRVITVWDRGPDERLRDLCLEYADKAGFTFLENRENVGFSGTVNQGIIEAGRDDVILLNSDTVHCGDWALRLQDAAYAHPKIAAVVPMTNNATIFSVPFPDGCVLPEEPLDWVHYIDQSCQQGSRNAFEMPVAHGFCTYVRRSIFDIIGLYDEVGFGIGQGEDNDFSMRARAAGYFVVASDFVFVGHFGGTSFGDEVMGWKLAGRTVMNSRYPDYMSEISHFFKFDPLEKTRQDISDKIGQANTLFKA